MLKQSTKWDELKLGDVLEKIVGGGTPSKAEPSYWGGSIPWASVKDMADGVYRVVSTIDHITELGLKNSASNLIPKGTVIISTRMGLGRCFRAEMDIAINQDLKALFPDGRTIPEFLIWLMVYLSPNIVSMGTGTTVKGIRLEQLQDLDVKLPPLSTQRKIASILSAYDDLIENNTRRIKILEEMAQALYREWFVKFRFPGHERVKMVESEIGMVPEGWEVKRLVSVADINASSLKKGHEPVEINYIDIASVSTGQIDKIEHLAFAGAPSRARRVVKHGDIIWSTVRPNRKSYSVILNPPLNLIVSTGFAVITAKHAPYTYLYHALTTDDFVGYLTNHATGAAYPAVNSGDFENALILHPPNALLEAYNTIVGDHFDHKRIMQQKNANLRRTRDLLLPKLISGEVDVEKIEIRMSDNGGA
jgi:type I restriction enzyme S subunit